MKPATSPDAYSFNIEIAKKSLEKDPNNEGAKQLIKFYEKCNKENAILKNEKNNLENDLRVCEWIVKKCKKSKLYSQNLYAALCNNKFKKINPENLLDAFTEDTWSCSWRHSGSIVANLREQGNYIDFYCSGMPKKKGVLPEGRVSSEILNDLEKLGWTVCRKNK